MKSDTECHYPSWTKRLLRRTTGYRNLWATIPKKHKTTTIKYINTPNSSNANDIYSGQIKSNDTVVGTKDEETRFTPVSVILVDLF